MHPRTRHKLSKSRFVAGLQCPKLLWWRVHEPDAPELQPEPGLQAIFDRGTRVGVEARRHVPGGALIDFPYYETQKKVEATRRALAEGAKVLYEASFEEDGVFVSLDVLERRRRDFVIAEVKSTLDVKDQHLPDLAIQLHVVRRAGLSVKRAELMHLNRECRFPDLSNLFARDDVTAEVGPLLPTIPAAIKQQQKVLSGALPSIEPGPHCDEPYPCPFAGRCQEPLPEHHVSTLYRLPRAKATALLAEGITTLLRLPDDFPAKGPAQRQLAAVRKNRLVVEPGLGAALAELQRPLAFLDFETIAPVIPVWPGMGPMVQVAVQLSCHRLDASGRLSHVAHLAEAGEDPRPAMAAAIIEACEGAKTVIAYNAGFEKSCIRALAAATPKFAKGLATVEKRLADLLPIVRDHVYHPAFGGSFSLKAVLPALVPGLGYQDLDVQEGQTASTLLEAVLLDPGRFTEKELADARKKLLAYCERDTLAMVRLLERLHSLA